MPTKDYEIKTEGRRRLLLSKQDDGNYHVKIMLGDNRRLATLVITPSEWKKLVNYSAGLEKK